MPQLTAMQRADIKKQETKAAEDQADPRFLISRKKTSSSKSTRNKKRKSNIGKITLGSSLGLGGIINSTTASTMAADVLQTIIQLIT